jgi:hypothetical protein
MNTPNPTHRVFRLSLCDEAGTIICTYDIEVRNDPRDSAKDAYDEVRGLVADIAADIHRTVTADLSE